MLLCSCCAAVSVLHRTNLCDAVEQRLVVKGCFVPHIYAALRKPFDWKPACVCTVAVTRDKGRKGKVRYGMEKGRKGLGSVDIRKMDERGSVIEEEVDAMKWDGGGELEKEGTAKNNMRYAICDMIRQQRQGMDTQNMQQTTLQIPLSV